MVEGCRAATAHLPTERRVRLAKHLFLVIIPDRRTPSAAANWRYDRRRQWCLSAGAERDDLGPKFARVGSEEESKNNCRPHVACLILPSTLGHAHRPPLVPVLRSRASVSLDACLAAPKITKKRQTRMMLMVVWRLE